MSKLYKLCVLIIIAIIIVLITSFYVSDKEETIEPKITPKPITNVVEQNPMILKPYPFDNQLLNSPFNNKWNLLFPEVK